VRPEPEGHDERSERAAVCPPESGALIGAFRACKPSEPSAQNYASGFADFAFAGRFQLFWKGRPLRSSGKLAHAIMAARSDQDLKILRGELLFAADAQPAECCLRQCREGRARSAVDLGAQPG
jgi:hypothetical protein